MWFKRIQTYGKRDVYAEVYLAKAQYYRNTDHNTEALQLCDETISLYPNYKRISALRELKDEIVQPRLYMYADRIAFPGDSLKLKVTHCNLDGFTVNLYRTTLSKADPDVPEITSAFYKKYTRKVKTEHYSLLRPADYQSADSIYHVQLPSEPGIYVVQLVPDDAKGRVAHNFIYLTRIKVLSIPVSDTDIQFVTLDAETGHPLPDVRITFYSSYSAIKNTMVEQKTTDATGKLTLPWNKQLASGSVMIGDEGAFAIPVSLQGSKTDLDGFYSYRVEATLTNQAGETQIT